MDAREIDIVQSLVPGFHRALDLACGTGRLTRVLSLRGETIGMDSSAAMLAQARNKIEAPFAQGDAFQLPFADTSFDAVIALRFLFHFADVESFLKNISRVLEPQGITVFDTFLWSPRTWRPFDPARWGGSVYAHSPKQIEKAALDLNLTVIEREYCFLFSPYIYRRLPMAVVRALMGIERSVPPRFRARVFWKLQRRD